VVYATGDLLKTDAVLQAEFSNRLKNPIPLMPLFMLQMSKK
jgi:hypothetical protein